MYGYECLSRIEVFEWFQRLKESWETTEEDNLDEEDPGQPCASKRAQTFNKLVSWSAKIVVWVSDLLLGWQESTIKHSSNFAWNIQHRESCILHQDNAPAHSVLYAKAFWTKHIFPVLDHPQYSPNVAFCDFYLFQKVKSELKGQAFRTISRSKQKRRELSTG